MTLRTIVADDEPLARRALLGLLSRESDIEIVAECRDGLEVVDSVEQLAPDIAFLDIQMPGLDGLAAASRCETQPVLVFATAHPDHAVSAFELAATDYLVKPFDDQRFERAVERARIECIGAEPNTRISGSRFEPE